MNYSNIYILSEPNSDKIRYVGKTDSNLEDRLYQHIGDAKCVKKSNHRLNWIRKLLRENKKPNIELIDIVPQSEWIFWECHYISLYKSWGFSLVNSTGGGDGGMSPSLELRNKIREKVSNIIEISNGVENHIFFGIRECIKFCKKNSLPITEGIIKGNNFNYTIWNIKILKGSKILREIIASDGVRPTYTFNHTEEAKRKIGLRRGWNHKKETRQYMSDIRMGIVFSDEHIKNLSISHQGQVNENLFKAVCQICMKTGNVLNEYKSISDAERINSINGIGRVCKGKNKSAGGYYWCYKSEYSNYRFKPFVKNVHIPKTSKGIERIDSRGKIKEFRSIKNASIDLGVHRKSIYKCLEDSTKKTKGYKFRYAA